jgi:hypothetical protein
MIAAFRSSVGHEDCPLGQKSAGTGNRVASRLASIAEDGAELFQAGIDAPALLKNSDSAR